MKVSVIIILAWSLCHCTEQSSQNRGARPSADNEGDLPGYIANDTEVDISADDGGTIESGNTKIIVPNKAAKKDFTVKLKQLAQAPQLPSKEQEFVGKPGGDVVSVEFVDKESKERLASKDLLKSYTLEQTFLTDDPDADHGFIVIADPGTAKEARYLVDSENIRFSQNSSALGLTDGLHKMVASTEFKVTASMVWLVKYEKNATLHLEVIAGDQIESYGEEAGPVRSGSGSFEERAEVLPGVAATIGTRSLSATIRSKNAFPANTQLSLVDYESVDDFGIDSNQLLNLPAHFQATDADGNPLTGVDMTAPVDVSLFSEKKMADTSGLNVVLLLNPGKPNEAKRLLLPGDLEIENSIDGRTQIAFSIKEADVAFAVIDKSSIDVSTMTPYPPPEVKSLVVTAGSPTSIQLTWEAPGGSVAGYRITYQSGLGLVQAACDESALAIDDPDVESYIVTGLLPEKDYSARICTVNDWDPVTVSGGLTSSVKTPADPASNATPSLTLTEPNGLADLVSHGGNFTIRWQDSDADNNASISLYYKATSGGDCNAGTLITSTPKEDDDGGLGSYTFSVANMTPGSYFICATIDDGVHVPLDSWSSGSLIVSSQESEIYLAGESGTTYHDFDVVATGNKIGVVYLDDAEGDRNVVFKLYSSGGELLATKRLSTNDDSHAHNLTIGWNGDQFGVVYSDDRDGGAGIDRYFHRLDEDGQDLGKTTIYSDATYTVSDCCEDLEWTGTHWAVPFRHTSGATVDANLKLVDDAGVVQFTTDLQVSDSASADYGNQENFRFGWGGDGFYASWTNPGTWSVVSLFQEDGTIDKRTLYSDTNTNLNLLDSRDGYTLFYTNTTSDQTEVYWEARHSDMGNTYLVNNTRKTTPNGSVSSRHLAPIRVGDGSAVAHVRGELGSIRSVYLTLLTDRGYELAEVKVSTSTLYHASHPSVAWTGSEFGVTYLDERDGENNLFFRRFDNNLDAIGPEQRLTVNDDNDASKAKILWDGSQYVLLYGDKPNDLDQVVLNRLDGIGSEPAAKLRFVSVPSFVEVGGCVPIELELQDQNDRKSRANRTLDFSLVDGGSGTFYKDESCTVSANYATLAKDESRKVVFYKNGSIETVTLQAIARNTTLTTATFANLDVRAGVGQTSYIVFAASDEYGQYSNDLSLLWDGDEYGAFIIEENESVCDLTFSKISPSGTRIGSKITIPTVADSSGCPKDIRAEWTGNGYGILYQEFVSPDWRLYFRTVQEDGTVSSETHLGRMLNTSNESYYDLVWNGYEFGLSYSVVNDSSYYDVHVGRFSEDGTSISSTQITPEDTRSNTSNTIAWDGQTYVIAYNEYIDTAFDGFVNRVYLNGSVGTAKVTDATDPIGYPSILWTGELFRVSHLESTSHGGKEAHYHFTAQMERQFKSIENPGVGFLDAASTRHGFIFANAGLSGTVNVNKKYVRTTFTSVEGSRGTLESGVYNGSEIGVLTKLSGDYQLTRYSSRGQLLSSTVTFGDDGDGFTATGARDMAWNGSEFGLLYVDHADRTTMAFSSIEGAGPGNPHSLRISEALGQVWHGDCHRIRVELVDADDQLLNPPYAIELNVTGSGVQTFTDRQCTDSLTKPTFPKAADFVDIWVKFSIEGDILLEVEEARDLGLQMDSATVNVVTE